jgi:hypothetical protein
MVVVLPANDRRSTCWLPQQFQSFAATAAQNRRITSRDDPVSKFMPKNLQMASSATVTDLSAAELEIKFS